jgi:hypothetical protein
MLIRIILYLASIAWTQKMVGYVFNRNQLAGIYPPEADSIGIPIFENQIFLGVLAILIVPTTVLGSRWFFRKLFTINAAVRVLALIAFAGFYAFAILISLGTTLSSADLAHIELGLSYAGILAVLSAFFLWDVVRIYREIFKKRQMASDLGLTEKQNAQH